MTVKLKDLVSIMDDGEKLMILYNSEDIKTDALGVKEEYPQLLEKGVSIIWRSTMFNRLVVELFYNP